MADGTDEDDARATRMDEWDATGRTAPQGGRINCSFLFVPLLGGLVPRDLRTAHRRGWRISFVVVAGRGPGTGFLSLCCFTFLTLHIP
jgi:hypothetical protein